MKLGLQLFTLIDIMQKENGLRTVLKHAADAGYDGVEFAGFYGLSADEICEELKKNNIVTAGIHLGWDNMSFENLDKNPKDVIGTAKKLGAPSVTVASYGGKTVGEWVDFAHKLEKYGKMFREEGMRLGYHNHRHEFEKLDGKYIIDICMENCSPENVFWELDPRHIVIAGEDPVVFAKKYCGRSPFIHMRDIKELTGPDTAKDAACGTGIVDLEGVIKNSGHHDWLIVEEGSDPDILSHIKTSAEYLRKFINA